MRTYCMRTKKTTKLGVDRSEKKKLQGGLRAGKRGGQRGEKPAGEENEQKGRCNFLEPKSESRRKIVVRFRKDKEEEIERSMGLALT